MKFKSLILTAAVLGITVFTHAATAVEKVQAVEKTGAFSKGISEGLAHPDLPQLRSTSSCDVVTHWLLLFSAPFCIGMLNVRTLQDLNLQVTTALPAANANNNSASIDTAEVNPGRVPGVELLMSMPATPSLVDAKTITLTLQDSADNATFNNVVDVPAQVVTGAGGVGAAALSYQFKLPIGLRRYVRLNAAVLAAGGDNTAISTTLAFVF